MGALDDLVTELSRLPGIGRKTAQRMTYHLLQQPGGHMQRLARALTVVSERVHACSTCGSLTEDDPCAICRDPRRDPSILCVVEEPSAVAVVEHGTGFKGRYVVLGGRLSPLEGRGPDTLRIDLLRQRMESGGVTEVILATNPSLEGEATATYLRQVLTEYPLRITRLARGLPMGGDLEYVDGVTLSHALDARQEVL